MISNKTTIDVIRSNRSETILDAAIEVFLRYGFKKTSMDDLARSSGISRQGLYIYFQTKELLFDAALRHLVTRILSSTQNIVKMHELSLEERLLAALNALHGGTLNIGSMENRSEVIDAARSNAAELIFKLEKEFVEIIARLLDEAGAIGHWGELNISAKQLSEHLFWVSSGAAQATTTPEYLKRMRIAIRIILSQTTKKKLPSSKKEKEIHSK
jgi:AcrR family transcriptional regulator